MTIYNKPLLSLTPYLLVFFYLCFTMVLFFFGPIDWPIEEPGLLALFLLTILLGLSCGYFLGLTGGFSFSNNRASVKVLTGGCLFALMLFFPAVYVYTHKAPWQIVELLSHQGDVYREMLQNLSEESVARKIVAFCRMIVAPFTFTVIPFAILCWSRLKFWQVVIFFAFLLTQLLFSLARGTDKEIADLLILGGSAGIIQFGRYYLRGGHLPRLRTLIVISIAGLCLLMTAFSLFSERKMARLGGNNAFCVAGNYSICASYDGPILSLMSDHSKFGSAMLSAYVSHGYYGLYLALNQPFDSMFGLGHSYILTSMYDKIAGDGDFYARSYLSKIKSEGWDGMSVWSSLFPWIANDISFLGVPFFIGLLAYILAKAWRSAVYGFDNTAAIVFTMLLLLFIYAPANNQLAQTADMYYCFWFWIFMWLARPFLVNGRLYVRK